MAQYQVLIAGASASGKSASLMNLCKDNPKKVAYITAEAGKSTPFPNNFLSLKNGVTDPNQVIAFFKQVESMPDVEYCVLDGFNYLMDLFENTVIKRSNNTQKAWGDYGTFIHTFFQEVVGVSNKKWIIIAHNTVELTPEGTYRYYVPIKGSVGKVGLESFFNIVIYAQRQDIAKIKEHDYDPEMLHITERDERLGYKHVFQVQPTKEVTGGRIRDLLGMWQDNQIWMDNDVNLLTQHLDKYFGLKSEE